MLKSNFEQRKPSSSISNGEYQELLHRVVAQNEMLESIKAEMRCCESIPVKTLQRILSDR